MNKDNAKDYLPLVQALAEGKTIQMDAEDEWFDNPNPDFTLPVECYRVKPEPRVFYVNEYENGFGSLHDSKEKLEDFLNHNGFTVRKICKATIEVLDETLD